LSLPVSTSSVELHDVLGEQITDPGTLQHRLGDQLGTELIFAVLNESLDSLGQHGLSIGSKSEYLSSR
jgi:hypothetical protein